MDVFFWSDEFEMEIFSVPYIQYIPFLLTWVLGNVSVVFNAKKKKKSLFLFDNWAKQQQPEASYLGEVWHETKAPILLVKMTKTISSSRKSFSAHVNVRCSQ